MNLEDIRKELTTVDDMNRYFGGPISEECRQFIINDVCRILQIDKPRIIFEDGLSNFGIYIRTSQIVMVRKNMNMLDEISTIAHELKHYQQHKFYKHKLFTGIDKPGYSYEDDYFEIEAIEFSIDMICRYGLRDLMEIAGYC
jgi:hypothetical protein